MSTIDEVRKARLKLAFETLAAAGIAQVTVTFDGCGDSGQIEEITVEGAVSELPERDIIWLDGQHTWGPATVGTVPGEPMTAYEDKWTFDPKTGKLKDLLEDIVWDYMYREHAGWENNDGAYGEFRFLVDERTVEYDHNTRFIDSLLDTHEYKLEE